MGATQPLRERGRTLIDIDPDQLVWVLLGRESRESGEDDEQVNYQLSDLREFVDGIGGRVELEVRESNVSSSKRRRVMLPDGTYGYRVVRPDLEAALTKLRRGEANALAGTDIDRITRDPRILEDLIDAVELYGIYVRSMTGNIDLTTDAGISAARSLVSQRNDESRNTSRRVVDGKRKAARKGQHNGGRMRPWGWRKDRIKLNKRESGHIRAALPRIRKGLTALTLANEWNKRKIPTVTGKPWRAATIRNMFIRPRMCGKVVYRGEIMKDAKGKPVRGRWEPILTDDEYAEVVRAWGPREPQDHSRLGGKGRGYRTIYLLSPFVRCGKCRARMLGAPRRNRRGEMEICYRCPGKGQGGCGGVTRIAHLVDAYVTELVIAEQEKIQFQKFEELPPWPKQAELDAALKRIADSTAEYEAGRYSAENYFPSLSRMEAQVAELRRESRKYERRRDSRRAVVADLRAEWDKPDFTIEMKQAAIAKSLVAVVIEPAGKGARFDPDKIKPVWREAG
ncbi:recombinase family protein [Amycolatopsis sp. NPDC054798]